MAIGQPLTSVSESHLPTKAQSHTHTKRRKECCSASQAHKCITTPKKSMATRCPRRPTAQPLATHPQIHCARCATTWREERAKSDRCHLNLQKTKTIQSQQGLLEKEKEGGEITTEAGGGTEAAAVCD